MEEIGVGNATQWAGAAVPREVTGQGQSPLAAWGRPQGADVADKELRLLGSHRALRAWHFLCGVQDVCAAGAPSCSSTVRGLGDVRRGLFHSLGVGRGAGGGGGGAAAKKG